MIYCNISNKIYNIRTCINNEILFESKKSSQKYIFSNIKIGKKNILGMRLFGKNETIPYTQTKVLTNMPSYLLNIISFLLEQK